MKKYILLAVFTAISLTGFAQFSTEGTVYQNEKKRTTNENSFVLGVRAGMPFLQSDDVKVGGRMKESFHFGLLTEFRLRNSLWLSTGLFFTKTYHRSGIYETYYSGHDYYGEWYSETSSGEATAIYYNLRLPVMLQYNWNGNPFSFQLHAGGFVELPIATGGKASFQYQRESSYDYPYYYYGESELHESWVYSFGFNLGGALSIYSFYLGLDMEFLIPNGNYDYSCDVRQVYKYLNTDNFGLLFKVSLGYDIPIK